VAIISYLILNEALAYFLIDITQLVILDLSSALLLVLFWLKDEQVTEKMKLIELSFLGTNLLALLMVNIIYFTNQDLSLLLFFFLATFLIAGLMQVKTYSLKFELENINKWTTSEVMIRYANTLRYYLSRRSEYIFKVYIHGYMEMHRQKCDNPTCSSRCEFTDSEKKLFESGKLKKEDEQILRTENIIKKIYNDGYKLTPISAELQLEYAIFLYELNEKELALKNLLLIKYQELSYDKYYRYSYIKEKIHREMCE
jgi:ABC-type multidrug transport system fused ATPase/permease subunit